MINIIGNLITFNRLLNSSVQYQWNLYGTNRKLYRYWAQCKKIIKIGWHLAKKSCNIDTKKKKKIQSNWESPPFLKSVKNISKNMHRTLTHAYSSNGGKTWSRKRNSAHHRQWRLVSRAINTHTLFILRRKRKKLVSVHFSSVLVKYHLFLNKYVLNFHKSVLFMISRKDMFFIKPFFHDADIQKKDYKRVYF